MTKLKPCPFCGGAARITDYYRQTAVTCTRCHVLLVTKSQTYNGAAKQWNERAKDEKPT